MSAGACSAKMAEDRDKFFREAASLGIDFVPVVGDFKSFAEADDWIDYTLAAAGTLPFAKIITKPLKEAKLLLKAGDINGANKLIKETSGEISGHLPSPGNISLPSTGIGSNAVFSVNNAQVGKKLGKHVEDFGGKPSSAADRQRVLEIINDIGSNPDKVIAG